MREKLSRESGRGAEIAAKGIGRRNDRSGCGFVLLSRRQRLRINVIIVWRNPVDSIAAVGVAQCADRRPVQGKRYHARHVHRFPVQRTRPVMLPVEAVNDPVRVKQRDAGDIVCRQRPRFGRRRVS